MPRISTHAGAIRPRSFAFLHTFTSSTTDVNLQSIAQSYGWPGPSTGIPVVATFTVNSGVVIGSSSTGSYAMVTGTFPVGSDIHLVNNYYIVGRGGDGGSYREFAGGNGGGAGGYCMNASSQIKITNNGTIAGGGGGGGGGSSWNWGIIGGGGGGGAGYPAGAGAYYNGSAGSLTTGGAFGTYHCDGGTGGALGAAGVGGWSYAPYYGGGGGAPGYYIVGNANVTWLVTGTVAGYAS